MKIVIIANPASARGAGSRKGQVLVDALDAAIEDCGGELSYDIVETRAPGEAVRTGLVAPGSASEIAREAVLAGADIVAAAGGDGTVGEVANGLIGTGTALGVLPMGTGNDFARTLGIGTDLQLAARTLIRGTRQLIDLGKIAYGGYFINVAGCGFDAVVASHINHSLRWMHGTAAYIASVLVNLARFRPAAVTLELDGAVHEESIMLCAVANARSYGGGMQVAPEADLSDGLFDIVLVGDVSRTEFLRAFPSVFSGTHLQHPKVKLFRSRRVAIRSSSALPILADGEEIGDTPVEFHIVPAALSVLTPNCDTKHSPIVIS